MTRASTTRRLSGIDLNLLVVLDALLSEANVTAAARRIGLSQSATSHALSRLRHILQDPILVRTPKGMVPTAFGRALARPVQDILIRCEAALLSHARFDPTESQDVFRIAMDVSAQINVLPALVERVHSQAPGVSILAKLPRPEDLIRDLELGEVDFAITAGVPGTTASIRAELLMTAQHVSILRRDHPRAAGRLSLKKFLDLDHVAVHRPGVVDLAIDTILAERSLERRVVLTVETPVPIPALVSRTDLVATLPSMIRARSDLQAMGLIAFKPPLELPAIQVFLVSHEQTQNSAAHRWMRASIIAAFETLT